MLAGAVDTRKVEKKAGNRQLAKKKKVSS